MRQLSEITQDEACEIALLFCDKEYLKPEIYRKKDLYVDGKK